MNECPNLRRLIIMSARNMCCILPEEEFWSDYSCVSESCSSITSQKESEKKEELLPPSRNVSPVSSRNNTVTRLLSLVKLSLAALQLSNLDTFRLFRRRFLICCPVWTECFPLRALCSSRCLAHRTFRQKKI